MSEEVYLELAVEAELAQSLAQAEKFQYEAERAKWEARREELSYLQEKSEYDWHRDGIYAFYRDVTRKSANQLLHVMSRWHQHDPNGDWTILLNSVGGDAYAGYSIIDQLRAHSIRGGGTHHIEIRVSGVAASMGGMILQAADHRVMGRYAKLMIHKPAYNYEHGATFQADELADQAESVRQETDQIINLFLERTDKITRPQILTQIRRKDWWITADDAIKWGFADAIL